MATVDISSIPTTCNHSRRPDDPHSDDLCETCKARYNLSLCTMKSRCQYCVGLSKTEFNTLVLVPRNANEKAKERRRLREKQNKAAGLPPRSPATSVKSTGSTPASGPPRRSLRDKFEESSRQSNPAASASAPQQSELVSLQDPGLLSVQCVDPDKISYNDLITQGIPVLQFVLDHKLHPMTIQTASTQAKWADTSLLQLSSSLHKSYPLQQSPQPTLPPSAAPPPSARSKPTATVSKAPLESDLDDFELQPPKRHDEHTSEVHSSVSQRERHVSISHDDSFSTCVSEPARSHTPADFHTIEAPLDTSHDEDESASFRDLIQFIADHSNVNAQPADNAYADLPLTASVLDNSTPRPPKLLLTTASLLENSLKRRELEFKEQITTCKARDLGRITPSNKLSVKMKSYEPADSLWSLQPPSMPATDSEWIPTLPRNSQIPLNSADAVVLESVSRSLNYNGSLLDSSFKALSSFFTKEQLEMPFFRQLITYHATLLRDNVKSSTYMSTSFLVMRRDAVLQQCKLPAHDKMTLRSSPFVNQPFLFDPEQLQLMDDKARQRAQDMQLARSMQRFVYLCHISRRLRVHVHSITASCTHAMLKLTTCLFCLGA